MGEGGGWSLRRRAGGSGASRERRRPLGWRGVSAPHSPGAVPLYPAANGKREKGRGAAAGPGRERGGAVGRAGVGLAVMADDGDGRLRTEGNGGGGRGGGGAEEPPVGGGMLLIAGLLALGLLAAYRLYLRWGTRSGPGGAARQSQAAALPRMKRRDFSLEQLREFDGTRNPRILLAVNGKVFDVTKGSKFYGPGETPGSGEGGPEAEDALPAALAGGGGGAGERRRGSAAAGVPCRRGLPA